MTDGDPAYRSRAADCAYQGAPGAFSEDAAIALLGTGVTLLPCRTLDEVGLALVRGLARSAVVPVMNSIAGAVPGAAELVARYELRVAGEVTIRVVQTLVAPAPVRKTTLKRVISHPVAVAQCRRFFQAHPHLTAVPAFDTAGAVAEVVREARPGDAAIASARAARLWGAVVLENGIQDCRDNFTRFVRVIPGP